MAHDNLDVLLAGQKIGNITYLGGDSSRFSFDDSYAQNPDRPTLSLAFKDKMGDLIRDLPKTNIKLLPFFSNLLPEGILRDYLAASVKVKPMREYALLQAVGEDLPGDVVVRPADDSNPAHHGDTLEETVTGNPSRYAMRFSLAGVQLKFSALQKNGRLTIPANGIGGSWIVKLPSLRFSGLAANEFSMMTLARMLGMDIPEISLLPLDQIEGIPEGIERIQEDAFVIKRFDRRKNGGRVHMEDFAQVFGVYPDDKYKKASYRSIAKVLWIETGEAGLSEFIRRLVFNTLIGNADMHLKNWSLLYPDGRTPTIAPGYDFVSTIAYLPDETAALKYARTKRMSDLSFDELKYLAAKAGVPEGIVVDTAQDTVVRFHEVWRTEKENLPIAASARSVIEAHLKVLPIAAGE